MTEKSYKRQKAVIISIIAVMCVLIVLAIVGIVLQLEPAKKVEAADIKVTVGKYVGERFDELSSDEVVFEKVEVFSDQPKGVVIAQSIEEGTEVIKGEVITLDVSAGNSEVEVPSIVGKNKDEAVELLKKNGFEVVVHYIYNDEGKDKELMVKSCYPAAGTKVAYESTVSIEVWGDDYSVTTTTTTTTTTDETTTQPTTEATTTTTTTTTTEPTTAAQPDTEAGA